MAETLDLEKALEGTEKTTETKENEQTQETTETQETKETTEEKTEEKVEEKTEKKDEFSDLEEGKDFLTLGDGRRVKMAELKDGYMRTEDYTQKTMDLAESRHQLSLAQSTTPVDTKEEKKTAIDLTEQNKSIDAALSEMDATDPMAIVMKGLVAQNNQVIDFINNQQVVNQEVSAKEATEADNVNAKRLIKEALEKEEKNYNLPTIKGTDGEVTDMKGLWNQLVLTDLQAVNETLNLAQFNHRVSQIGKKAYARLRTIISVANASKPKETTADDTQGSQTETKSKESTEKTPKTENDKIAEKEKGLTLNQRLENAFDRRINK